MGSRLFSVLIWALATLCSGFWASDLFQTLAAKVDHRGGLSVAEILIKNSGSTTLLISTVLISLASLSAVLLAVRGRALPLQVASVALVTAAALRSIQLFYEGSATIQDADILSGVVLSASLLYFGSPRLWWAVLMPLGTGASLTPLIWLEYFKASNPTLLSRALVSPALAFVAGSVFVVLRELRARARTGLMEISTVRSRSQQIRKQMHQMESDLKTLLTLTSRNRAATPVQPEVLAAPLGEMAEEQFGEQFEVPFDEIAAGPIKTTDYSISESEVAVAIETCSYDEIDNVARQVLDEARLAVKGKPNVRLLLTAPETSGLAFAVRGSRVAIATWLRGMIADAIDSLGGFPDGVVRVTIRPGLSSVVISIEDNGRGFGALVDARGSALSVERMTALEVRKSVEAIGGRFDIQGRLGVGSRLTMELPRVDALSSTNATSGARPQRLYQQSGFKSGGFHPSKSSSRHA